MARNKERIAVLWKNTLAPAEKLEPLEILVEFGQRLNGQEGHVPLEPIRLERARVDEIR